VRVVGAPGNEYGYSMVEVESGGDTSVVTMSCVLTELGAERIDLLKCDIEGAEQELFESSASWIGNVGILAVECHGEFTAQRLGEALARNGVKTRTLMFEATPEFGCEQIVLAVTSAA
jgi:hypothetical protein